MEFGPVFRALVHNRVRFWLITVEVALTMAIVVNCVSLALDFRGKFLRDSGMDVDNIVVVRVEPSMLRKHQPWHEVPRATVDFTLHELATIEPHELPARGRQLVARVESDYREALGLEAVGLDSAEAAREAAQ